MNKFQLAEWMHDNYEQLAKANEWQTQESTRVKFEDLPEANKSTMLALADKMLNTFLIIGSNVPVSGALPRDIAKEAAFLLQIDGVTHCPKWVEGVGDCRMLDCLFCRKQRCVEALEEQKRQ